MCDGVSSDSEHEVHRNKNRLFMRAMGVFLCVVPEREHL